MLSDNADCFLLRVEYLLKTNMTVKLMGHSSKSKTMFTYI